MALSDAASLTGAVRAATLGSGGVCVAVVIAAMEAAFKVAAALERGWRDVGARGGACVISDLSHVKLDHDSDRNQIAGMEGLGCKYYSLSYVRRRCLKRTVSSKERVWLRL